MSHNQTLAMPYIRVSAALSGPAQQAILGDVDGMVQYGGGQAAKLSAKTCEHPACMPGLTDDLSLALRSVCSIDPHSPLEGGRKHQSKLARPWELHQRLGGKRKQGRICPISRLEAHTPAEGFLGWKLSNGTSMTLTVYSFV